MIQVAILGYGRQGKKHARFWRHIGIEPTLFTRSASDHTYSISEFSPEDYSIIICAIHPCDEQTKMLREILQSGYSGYLIIEKPVTFSKRLLVTLAEREKTIFFIDEAYLDLDIKIGKIDSIDTASYVPDDALSVQEHAIGCTLRAIPGMVSYDDIPVTYVTGNELHYILKTDAGILESLNGSLTFEGQSIAFSFDVIYSYLFKHISDEGMMKNIRSNYLNFRLHSAYGLLSDE